MKTFILSFFLLIFSEFCAAQDLPLYLEENAVRTFQMPLIEETVKSLEKNLDRKIHLTEVSDKTLLKIISKNEPALFISSSAFLRQKLNPYEVKPIASITRAAAEDPDKTEGSLVLVRMSDVGLSSIKDLKGKRISYSSEFGFFGLFPAFDKLGEDDSPGGYFRGLSPLKASVGDLVRSLEKKETDAVILPVCVAEETGSLGPEVRALSAVSRAEIDCLYSSELYPGPILAANLFVSSETISKIHSSIFGRELISDGFQWAIPKEFSKLDDLLGRLRIDAFSTFKENFFFHAVNKYWPFALAVFIVILSLFLLSLLLKYLVNKRTSQLLKLIDEKKELLRREKENFKRIETLQKVGIVGLMSSMFAHEVRQPLSAISCWGHVLKKLAGQRDNSKEMVPLIEKMVSAAAEAEKKITDIRDVLRTQEPKLEKIDLTEIISEELKSLHETLEKKIKVEFKKTASRPIVLMARTELEVVVHNIFKNSIQAQENSSEIFLSITLETKDNRVFFRLADGGPKVTQDQIDEMKIPFYSSKKEGLGLGTAIVQTIMKRYGGWMELSLSPRKSLSVLLVFVGA